MKLTVPTLLLQLLFVWTARPLRLKIHKANLINTLLQLICIHFYTISAMLLIPFCSRKTKSATYKDTKTESPLSQETTTTPVQNRTHAMWVVSLLKLVNCTRPSPIYFLFWLYKTRYKIFYKKTYSIQFPSHTHRAFTSLLSDKNKIRTMHGFLLTNFPWHPSCACHHSRLRDASPDSWWWRNPPRT